MNERGALNHREAGWKTIKGEADVGATGDELSNRGGELFKQ
jgi:hypothetical protein